MNSLLKSKRCGSATALMLLVVIILFVTGVGLLSAGLHTRIFAIRNVSEIAAQCAVDAGLTKAVFEMNEKLKVKPWDDSTLPEATNETLPGCDATFSYTVIKDSNGVYNITATGISADTEKTIGCSLQLESIFDYAIFSDQKTTLKNGVEVDWYNNDPDDEALKIGTNSTASNMIDLALGVIINGDVRVGVGGDPDVVIDAHSGATITGDIDVLTEAQVLPPITVPQWLDALPSGGQIKNSTTITTSGKYDKIDIGNKETITIDGAVTLYITGGITLGNSSEIEIVNAETNPDASLTLYSGGNIEVKNGGVINNLTQDAQKLEIYGLSGCEDIVLKNGSDLYGVIYAPDADVVIDNSAAMYGAIAAKSIEQKNSAPFNYDTALRDVSVDDECVRFVIGRWFQQ